MDWEYYINFIEKTLLEAIEKMLEYLLDENILLTKNNDKRGI